MMKKDKPKMLLNDPKEKYKIEAKLLLSKVRDTYFNTLDIGEYGSPDADEIIIRVILNHLLKCSLTTSEKIKKVLQHLPQRSECLVE